MRIAWHMPTLRRHACGLSTRALELARRLGAEGHDIAFYVREDKTDIAAGQIAGLRVERLRVGPVAAHHWCLQAHARRRSARRLVRRIGADHDVFVSCQPEAIISYAAHHDRKPVLFICGGTTLLHDSADAERAAGAPWHARSAYSIDRFLKHRNEAAAFRAADAVVFDSLATRQLVIGAYSLDPVRCHTVHGGVDPDVFRPPQPAQRAAARRSLGIAEMEFVVVWTGRFSPEKNIELLLDAWRLGKPRPGRLLLIGDGPQREQVIERIRGLCLEDRVWVVGEQADVRPYLLAADVYAFPSQGESFGGALVEAMACGTACVGLAADGRRIFNANSEIIGHDESGLLVRSRDPVSFAAAIDRLADDVVLREHMGQAARRRACAHFTWDAGARRLDRIVRGLVDEAARRRAPSSDSRSSATESRIDAPRMSCDLQST